MAAVLGVASAALVYPFGILLDRWGSQKTLLASAATACILMICGYLFSLGTTSAFFWRVASNVPLVLLALALMKWTVDTYPRSRYGQFASAGALFNSAGSMLLAPLAGWVFDILDNYRFYFLWFALWYLIGTLCLLALAAARKFRPADADDLETSVTDLQSPSPSTT
jgi:MFS family permease